jgi:Xaa-Pro dipeptidase
MLFAMSSLMPGQELAFPQEEYHQRLSRVQAQLQGNGFAGVVLFDPANILWVSGFQTVAHFTFQALVVPSMGAPILVTRKVNSVIAGITPTLGRVVLWGLGDDPIEMLGNTLNEFASSGPPMALEVHSWSLSIAEHQRLIARVKCEFRDYEGGIEQFRITKSPTEVERSTKAARSALSGLKAAIAEIRPGASENDLAAAMHDAVFRSGGEYIRAPLVSTGERTSLLFGTWRRRTLCPGDTVLLESAACYDRYHAMITRTSVLGHALPKHHAAANALAAVLDFAENNIKTGAICGDVDASCRQIMIDHGFEGYRHTTAYSVGIAFPPSWWEGNVFDIGPDTADGKLEKNMVFHVVPTVTVDDFTIMMSETMVVGDDKAISLTAYPRELVEIPI